MEVIVGIEEWKQGIEQGKGRVLGVVGPHGIGKTALLDKFCKEDSSVGAKHFFTYDDTQSCSVRACILSIARQLGLIIDEEEIGEIEDTKRLFHSALCTPLVHMSRTKPLIVVLDALDAGDDRELLTHIVSELWEKETPHWLGLLFSCRAVIDLHRVQKVQSMSYKRESSRQMIETFIKGRFEEFGLREVEEVLTFAVDRSEGFFLYAQELVKALAEENEIGLFTISDLMAKGTFCDTCHRLYFRRLLHETFEGDRDLYQRLFAALAVSRFPLSREFVSHILLKEDDTEVVWRRVLGELLVMDGGCEGLSLPHNSMRSFLLDRKRAGRELYVSAKVGHHEMATILTQDKTSANALFHLVFHLLGAKDWENVKAIMLEYDWLHALVSLEGAAEQVVWDLDASEFHDPNVSDVVRSVDFALEHLAKDPDLLPFELFGRIQDRTNPVFDSCCRNALIPLNTCFANKAHSSVRKIIKRHRDSVGAVACNSDVAVSASADETVRVWDIRTGACLLHLQTGANMDSVAIDGNVLVAGSSEGAFCKVWDWRTGVCLHVQQERSLSVTGVAIKSDRVVAAFSSSWESVVKVWDWRVSDTFKTLPVMGYAPVVAIEGDIVVCGSYNRVVCVWDARDGNCLQQLQGHTDVVVAVAVDGDCVVSGSWDRTVRVWDWREGTCTYVLDGHTRTVTSVVIENDLIVSGSWDRQIRVWNQRTGACMQVLEGHRDDINSLAIMDGSLVSGSHDQTLRIWNLVRPAKEPASIISTTTVSKEEEHCVAVAFSTTGEKLLAGFANGSIRIYDSTSGNCVQDFKGPSKEVLGVGFANSTTAVGVFENGAVRVWDCNTGEMRQGFHILTTNIATKIISRVFHQLAINLTGSKRLQPHEDLVHCVAINGNTLVTGSRDQTVRLWDIQKRTCSHIFRGHTDVVCSVAIDADTVVSGSCDHTVRIWDQCTSECLHVLRIDGTPHSSIGVKGDVVAVGTTMSMCTDLHSNNLFFFDRLSGARLSQETGRPAHIADVMSVAIWNRTVFSASWDETIRVWTQDSNGDYTSKLVAVFDDPVSSITLHAQENALYVAATVHARQGPIILTSEF